jgi:hypothetical protein
MAAPVNDDGTGCIVHITPLHHWSQLNHATAEAHAAAGKCLAFAMGGNEPYPAAIAELRELLERALGHLDDAATMRRG